MRRSGIQFLLIPVVAAFLLLGNPTIGQQRPNWQKIRSCFINVTEKIGGNILQDRLYCCEGWTTQQDEHGNLVHCSAYVGSNIGSNRTNKELLTLSEWEKTVDEVKKLQEEISPFTTVLGQQGGNPIDNVRKEVEKYSKIVDDLDDMAKSAEKRVKHLESLLSSSAQYNPCTAISCLEHPDAICTVASTKCGKKYAMFIDEESNQLSCSNVDCPPSDECTYNPCENVTCRDYPEAVCLVELCCEDFDRITWLFEGDVVQCPNVVRGNRQINRRKRSGHEHC